MVRRCAGGTKEGRRPGNSMDLSLATEDSECEKLRQKGKGVAESTTF